ncbi:effector-associated constant component EACC1 [Streptomyces sp. CA-132043]|uniref:effector-associated constant component EACC1 n=1 Tax=Streptomyces sp. CA-132043 TaxID=3240048 RepID=UPI003D8AB73D
MWALIPEIAAGLGASISAVATSIAFRLWRGKRDHHPDVVVTRQSGSVRITVSGADAEQVHRALASLDGEGVEGSDHANGDGPQSATPREQ